MARKADTARKKKTEEHLPPATLARRLGWVALAAAWVFVLVSLASFDSADPPSHVVAVHNHPPVNLCGRVGSLIAYGSYHMLGLGAWVMVGGVAAILGVTVTGRVISHPFVRGLGLLIMAVAIGGVHALILPDAGPLPGAPAGLLGHLATTELAFRFNGVGTLLLLLAAICLGAIVAMDTLVLAVPRLLWFSLRSTTRIPRPKLSLPSFSFGRRPALAGAGAATDVASAAAASKSAAKRGKTSAKDRAIDPEAGGIGGTEAFDPEEYALDDEEWEDEEEDEDEDEDEDEWEDEEDDEEWEEDEADEEAAQPRRRLSAEELREKISRLPVRMGGKTKAIAKDEDIPREENFEGYEFPTLELLENPETNYSENMESLVRKQAEHLEEALQTYGIDGEVIGIESGPTVTLYAVQLAPGTKVAKVNAISSDLARSLKAQSIRIVPNMVGRSAIGIEVPNPKKEKVRLKELMSGGHAKDMGLPMFLGKDASGEPLVGDLTALPHMLIAGTTGSGKSVCMNTIIMSWLYTKRPDEMKMVLVDPKMVELSQFADIPHLMCPVVTEMGRAAAILEWAVNKMEERYELLKEARVRDIATYNTLSEEELYEAFAPESDEEKAKIPKKLPFIVFVIDELADLILTHKEVEQHIVRIAQKARAVGIHLILATQRPQANVVTGLIKSNMPGRISFKVASGMDSRIVLDHKGAELLLGQGDMLYLSPHSSELRRAQGTLVTDGEIRRVVKFLKDVASPTFERSIMNLRSVKDDEFADEGLGPGPMERDPLFDQAVEIMIETGRGSVSLLQRRLAIGYSRASRLVDQMGLAGILGEHRGSVAREVVITMDDWLRMKELEEFAAADGMLPFDDGEGDAVEIVDGKKNDDAVEAEDAYDGEEEEGEEYEDEEEDDDEEDEDEDEDEEEDDDEYEYEDEVEEEPVATTANVKKSRSKTG